MNPYSPCINNNVNTEMLFIREAISSTDNLDR